MTAIWMDSSYRSEPRIEMKFHAQFIMDPIEYRIACDEKDVFYASSRLDEFLSGLRQWYSIILRPGLGIFFFIPWLTLPIIYFSLNWLERALGLVQDERASAAAIALLWIVGGTAISGVGVLSFVALRKWLFPNGIFAIGDGLDRYRNLVGTRKLVGSGIVLALLVSLAASWIYAQLS